MNINNDSIIERLSKVMATRGMCSRREADSYIEQGLVWVDGVQINVLGTKINPQAKIELHQNAKKTQSLRRTVLLHKPIGYVSGQPEPSYVPAITLIKPENYFNDEKNKISGKSGFNISGLAPAGRLDIDSTGLLVLTQDGRIARILIGEDSQIEKEYLVRVNILPTSDKLKLLNFGLSLDGKNLKPAKVSIQNDQQLMFILREGKKRQIRRMCELVGLQVLSLKRVRIGKIKLGNLPVGKWRFLAEQENF